ncbi:MAG TPA: M42 family peptidase [Candidatus Coatesbacteria bacterium]|nr:M42 family peptidase [Candidatus Coatesbacteria bacterium]
MDEILRKLTGTVGLTGMEEPASRLVCELWETLVDELHVDRLGSVVGLKRGDGEDGKRLRLVVLGHLDQIGLMVQKIEPGGFLRLQMVGGVDRRILPGQLLTVYGAEPVQGVVGAVPPHLQKPDEQKKVPTWHDLYLDTGLPEREVKRRIRVGDPVGYPTSYVELQNGRRAMAGADDRSAVAAITWALELARRQRHTHDIYAVAEVQEEWTGLGAATAAFGLEPDCALVIDVDQGRHEGVAEKDSLELGKGPSVTHGLNNHPELVEAALTVAAAQNIPHQKFFWPSPYGTDGATVETLHTGIPTINFGIPLRYMHSTVEVLDIEDVKNAGRLILAVADAEGLPVVGPVDW